MKEAINEVLQRYKGEYTDIEIYRFTEPSKYYGGRIHTDTIEYLSECFNIDYNKTFDLDELEENGEEWQKATEIVNFNICDY